SQFRRLAASPRRSGPAPRAAAGVDAIAEIVPATPATTGDAIVRPAMKALRAVWAGIVDGYNELFPIVGMNLLWLLFNIPLAFVGLVAIQIITVAMGVEDESRQSVAVVFSLLYAVLLVT